MFAGRGRLARRLATAGQRISDAGSGAYRVLAESLGLTILLAAFLSLAGLHLTGFVLLSTSLRSAAFVLLVVMAAAFLDRLRQLRENQLTTLESPKQSGDGASTEGHSDNPEIEDQRIDVESANRQVRRLVKLGAALTTLVGLYIIWSWFLPSLQILDRVQLLPVPKMISVVDAAAEVKAPPITSQFVAASEQNRPPDQQEAQVQEMPAGGALAAIPGTQGPGSSAPAPQAATEWSLTLAGLLISAAIVILTTLLAKSVPGLFDFFVLSRLPLAGGDRRAITTIGSYIIVIIGISAMAGQLGLRWSQVQWLAAAFSFGLGFGLQDIFANFFSGLVLLFERPMRVGDFCRFGDQLGTVESIGLRSTRVRGLDRTVINVPNADFSKKELVNFAKRDRMLLKTVLGHLWRACCFCVESEGASHPECRIAR